GDPGGMGGRPAARSNEGSSNDHPEGARRKKPRLHRCRSKEGASAGAGPESIALRRRISPRRRLRRAAAVAAQAPASERMGRSDRRGGAARSEGGGRLQAERFDYSKRSAA